jgi:hypothetical protein
MLICWFIWWDPLLKLIEQSIVTVTVLFVMIINPKVFYYSEVSCPMYLQSLTCVIVINCSHKLRKEVDKFKPYYKND